jgi:hypothetical protein
MKKRTIHHDMTTLDLSIHVYQAGIDLAMLNLPAPSEAFSTIQSSIRKEREILNNKLKELKLFDERSTAQFMAYRKSIISKKYGGSK